jgi:hypothetical protein
MMMSYESCEVFLIVFSFDIGKYLLKYIIVLGNMFIKLVCFCVKEICYMFLAVIMLSLLNYYIDINLVCIMYE